MWPWKKKKTEINEDTEIVSDLEKTDPSLRSAVRYYLENEDDEDIWKKFAGIAEAGSLEAYCIAKAL